MARKSIADAIKAKVEPQAEEPVITAAATPTKAKTTKKQSSRAGQKHIGGYYPPECLKALKLIAVEDEMTLEDVIATAMNQFLSSRGKAPIFPVKSDAG
ncbi:MAG: ribbon-helix-helix domain-containing protein [Cyanobacteria bacterium J06633_23]